MGLHIVLERSGSPWNGFTSSYEEEERGRHVKSIDFPSYAGGPLEYPAALAGFFGVETPAVAIDRKARQVFISNNLFTDIERPDATSLAAGSRVSMGCVSAAGLAGGPESLFRFLVESHLIRCIAHTDAFLDMGPVEDDGRRARASFFGEHHYYTSRRETSPLAFRIELEITGGALFVEGL